MSEQPRVLVDDPRTNNVDETFQQLISGIARAFGTIAQIKGRRATHSYGTTAAGVLTVLDNLDIPEHKLFKAGARYPVLLRHANIKGFPDDAILDGRGATMRILAGDPDADLADLALHQYLVDILMSTGRSFTFAKALPFSQWVAGDLETRAKMIAVHPKIAPIFSEIIRDPDSYTKLHYYSETTYSFIATDGTPYFLRYRLINADNPQADEGWLASGEVRLPLDYLPRRAWDTRSETYLQDDFKQQVMGEQGVNYLLQLQLQPVTDDSAQQEAAKDCTEPWDEDQYPFYDVAQLHLEKILPPEWAEPLEFNPYHAPPELALILAQTALENASVNHLRSIVYQVSADMRKYQLPDAELVNWGVEQQPSPQDLFPYAGDQPGSVLPSFDPTKPLPTRVQPKPAYLSQFGLKLLPAQQLDPALPELGIVGVDKLLATGNVSTYMPANLTRSRPDKFSDDFFVERRLNGFNPGKINPVKGKAWQYAVKYNCRKYTVDPAGILPEIIEARFAYGGQYLKVHSIYYILNGEKVTNRPGDSDWEWAKRLFRCAEFVFQEVQSHLGRTHMNLDQYAMAYYRNIDNNPIKLLLEPHLEGLLNINKLGASLIKGPTGFIPEASSLNPQDIDKLIIEEVSQLTYHKWNPRRQALPDNILNNHFDRAALAVWDVLKKYVKQFFRQHEAGIEAYWSEVERMSTDLVKHSILKPKLGTLAIANKRDLRQLCTYIIYLSSFFHSWVNNKQYEDGGDISYATIGLWDGTSEHYNPIEESIRHAKQVTLLWTLSNVRYNPIMAVGPSALKDALWEQRAQIEPGIPLANIMMSTNI